MVLQEYQIPEGRSTTPSKPNVGIVEKTNHHSTFFIQQPKNVFEIEGNLEIENLDHGSLHEKTKKNSRLLATTIVTIQFSVSKQQSRSLSLFSYPPLSLLC